MKPLENPSFLKLSDAVDAACRAVEAGDLQRAYATLTLYDIRADETPALALFQASMALALQRWAEALPMFDALRRATPGEHLVHLHYASCLIGLNRIDEADAMLRSSQFLGQECSNRFALLARIAARRGDDAGVRDMLRRALRSNADERILAEVVKRPRIAALIRGGEPGGPARDDAAARLN